MVVTGYVSLVKTSLAPYLNQIRAYLTVFWPMVVTRRVTLTLEKPCPLLIPSWSIPLGIWPKVIQVLSTYFRLDKYLQKPNRSIPNGIWPMVVTDYVCLILTTQVTTKT